MRQAGLSEERLSNSLDECHGTTTITHKIAESPDRTKLDCPSLLNTVPGEETHQLYYKSGFGKYDEVSIAGTLKAKGGDSGGQ